VDFFATLGKETFPSVNCYRLRGNRLKHTALLRLLNVPHPRTRVYYGHKQKREILNGFAFPLVAKKAREAADGKQVFLINNREQLDWYNQHFNPALIQEYVAPEKELRVLVLNCDTPFGYRRNVIRSDSMDSASRKGIWKTLASPTWRWIWFSTVAAIGFSSSIFSGTKRIRIKPGPIGPN
jgi:ribosomal protein S6--L-glutamate ligase